MNLTLMIAHCMTIYQMCSIYFLSFLYLRSYRYVKLYQKCYLGVLKYMFCVSWMYCCMYMVNKKRTHEWLDYLWNTQLFHFPIVLHRKWKWECKSIPGSEDKEREYCIFRQWKVLCHTLVLCMLSTLRPRQNARHFVADSSKCILNGNI